MLVLRTSNWNVGHHTIFSTPHQGAGRPNIVGIRAELPIFVHYCTSNGTWRDYLAALGGFVLSGPGSHRPALVTL